MAEYVFSRSNMQLIANITSSGSWTVPSGVTLAMFELTGGGGTLLNNGYRSTICPVTAGNVFTITLGAAGTSTTAGGNSSITNPNGVIILAAAGQASTTPAYCKIYSLTS
ncbi:MAG: hypothetical protein QW478_10660 [Candidatus Micrarchaeaceae archaeon]